MFQRYFQNHCAAEVLLLEIGGVGGEKICEETPARMILSHGLPPLPWSIFRFNVNFLGCSEK